MYHGLQLPKLLLSIVAQDYNLSSQHIEMS